MTTSRVTARHDARRDNVPASNHARGSGLDGDATSILIQLSNSIGRVRHRAFGLPRGQTRMALPGAMAAIALLAMFLLLPEGFTRVHAAALIAAVAGFAALHLACSSGIQAGHEPGIARQSGVGDRLEQRIEELQDLQWQISEREVRYRDLLDQQHDVIVRRDSDGRLTFANRAFARVFGHEPDTAAGQPFKPVVLEGADLAPLSTADNERRRTSLQLIETTLGPRWISWDEQLVPGGSAGSFEIQSVGRDVTETRRAEAELTEARDQAEAANRAKSRFLAAMSHEIRTPMNGILGMSSLLIETAPAAEQKTYIEAIDHSARTLLALIDEILDFSRIEAGKLVLAEAPFTLSSCIASAVGLLAPRAHEKGLDIAWTLEADLPRRIVGDEARIRQVLLNLISNAVKFTDTGGVVIHVSGRATPGARGTYLLSIAVRDTGIGLSDADKSILFLEFEQADAALRRRNGGTGLGLAISKRIARAMGGDITVVSSPGHGSTFTLAFAATAPAADGEASGSDTAEDRDATGHDPGVTILLPRDCDKTILDQRGQSSLSTGPLPGRSFGTEAAHDRTSWHAAVSLGRPPRVLLAEDNDINALLARRMIERSGCAVEWVKNGQDAITRMEAAIRGRASPIDLVLMDIFMPHVDGVEAAQTISHLFLAAPSSAIERPPIVALTANAFAEDRQRYIAAGMDDYLSKPFDRPALIAVLEKWLPCTSPTRAAASARES